MVNATCARRTIILAASLALATAALAEPPASAPVRSQEQLIKELNETGQALFKILPDGIEDLKDPVKRQEIGKSANPLVKRALAIIDQLPPTCSGGNREAMKMDWAPMLVFFGDEESTRVIRDRAAGDKEDATDAKLCLATADFMLALEDKAKIDASLQQILHLAARHRASDSATVVLIRCRDDERLLPEQHKQIQAALDQATSPTAVSLRAYLTTQPSK